MFDYRYNILSRKDLSEEDKSSILSIYTSEEIDNLISSIYDEIISEATHKNKNDKELMSLARVYSILIKENKKRKIKKLEIKIE